MMWHSPWAFTFLALIVAAVLYVFLRYNKLTSYFQFSSLEQIKKINPGLRAHLVKLPLILKSLALVFAVIALARPQEADTQIKRNVEGIDIVVALDISDSMLIEDMKPQNRLQASKQTIKNFIQKRFSDRIGLVVFAGESYTRVPMTLDYPILLNNLASVTTTQNIKMGTAIGVALATAVARLKDSQAKSKVVIFLTDGENNSGTIDPHTAIDIAKTYDVKIYSIGMGKDGETRLPVYVKDSFNRVRKTYKPFFSKVNEELLGQMAQETEGKFYRANTTNALVSVFEDINELEKSKIESTEFTNYIEHFHVWLLWAVGLYLMAFLLGHSVLRKGP